MRVKILVEVNTDPVPGWGYDPQDYVNHIQNQLDQTIPHYHPKVSLIKKESDGNSEENRAAPERAS